MGSKWKLPSSLKGEGASSGGRESPAFHRLHEDEKDEELRSLVDSDDSDDDLMAFDGIEDGDSTLQPVDNSHNERQKKHRKSPLHLLSPLAKSTGDNDTKGEERRSLIEDEEEVDTNENQAPKHPNEVEQNVASDGDNTPAIKKPAASKWGMLKKPAANEPNKPVNEERSDVVGAAVLNKDSLPEPSKPGSAWLKLKDMKNNAPTEEAPDTSTSAPAAKLSGWGKLRARQNLPSNDQQPPTYNEATNNTPKVSGWGKLRARQNLPNNDSSGIEPANISTENPGPRKLDSLANAAYAVHATQKVTGLMKDTTRANIRNRLALKERMAKLVAERLTVKQIFKRYVETSTLHGFCYVFSDTFMIRRALWAILMILGAVYFLIKLNDGIIKYFSYPFSTLASMEYVDNLIFPAMSFCPINPYMLYNFNQSVLHKLQQSNGLPLFSNLTDPGYDIDGQQLHDAILNSTHDIADLAQECDWVRQDTDHPEITFRDCGPHNLTKYISERGEVCFTLNSGKEGHPLLNVDRSGLNQGYELLFDLNAPGSIITHSYNGMRVILHDQAEPPTSGTGFVLTPGFKSFVRMERTEVKQHIPF